MKKAIGYLRISKDDERSISLDYQESEVRKLAKREGFKLVRIETDNGISGKTIAARPAVQRVLRAVDAKEIDAVVVYRSDRMSRDGIEALKIERLFSERGVACWSCTEGQLAKGDLDSDFLAYIRSGLNERERKLVSLRTSQALQRKREKGERLGRPAFGWRVEHGRLVEDAREQAVLDRVAALKGKGFSVRQITAALEQEGIRNPAGRPYSKSAVGRIVRMAA